MTDAWTRYAADFDAMTDRAIEEECMVAQAAIDDGESWLEAVASWEAAGKPRTSTPAS